MACLSSFAVPHEPGSSRCPTLSHDATTRFFARAIKSRNYNCNYIGKFGLYAWCGPEVSAYVSWSALSDPARALSRLFQKSFWKFAQKKIRFQKAIFLIFGKKIFSFREFGSCRLEFRARDPTIPEFSKTESHSTSTPSVRVRRLDCPGECLLVMVKLACGSTEAKGRLLPRADMRRVAIPQRSEPPDLIVTDALCCQILSGQREHIQLGQLKRREFTKLLGGAVAWPLAARAQRDAGVLVGTLECSSLKGERP
jgi:hypothetical protein